MKMDATPYHSILICDHTESHGAINLFANGLPLGAMDHDSLFFETELFKARNPFSDREALAAYLERIAASLRANQPTQERKNEE